MVWNLGIYRSKVSILDIVNPVSDWFWLCILNLDDPRVILTVFLKPAAERNAGKTVTL